MLEQTTFGASGHAIGKLHLFDGVTNPIFAAPIEPCTVIRIPKGQPVLNPHGAETFFHIVLRGALPHLTGSFGVAMLAPYQDADDLISDAALYRAKEAGRNQVAF